MKFISFVSFLLTVIKGGILIGIGIIIKDHFNTFISKIVRGPIPKEVNIDGNNKLDKIIRFIGLLIIILGSTIIIMSLSTWIIGKPSQSNGFNLKF